MFLTCFGIQNLKAQTNTPCNSGVLQAPNIAVGSSCSYTNGTTVGAAINTNAANGGTPTCGSMGEDVWYSFTAPASGAISIQTQEGSISDGVMAVYSGSCGAWTEVACDDDGGLNSMPQLDLTGLTPGNTYLIRFWDYAGGTGTFSLCVTETVVSPPPTNVTCLQMNPICTNSGLNFPAQSGNNNIDPGNNYDCLFSQPNPTWYYLKIATPGVLNMTLSAGSDVDYILYGPYNSLATAQADCGSMGSPTAEVVDCSYSFVSTEYPTIPNALVGQVYVLLITNYADVEQNITLTASGSATTDCAIIYPCNINTITANPTACNSATNTYSVSGSMTFTDNPTTGQLIVESCEGVQATYNCPLPDPFNYTINNIPAGGGACDVTAYFTADPTCTATLAYTAPSCVTPCNLNAINVNVSACQPDNTFNLTGSVSFTNAPSSGTLTFTDCNGNSMVYNAPFVSPLNWSINNIQSDGTVNCSVTAVFSADPACTITTPLYDNPAACGCAANAGTYSTQIIGSSTNNYVLCYSDEIELISNNDFIYAAEANNPPGPAYDPSMSWAVYSCPPTQGLNPMDDIDINTDPCFLGIIQSQDFIDSNDMSFYNSFPANTFANNTIYLIPLTIYSASGNYYSYTNTSLPCYDFGNLIAVQYLPQITTVVNENCVTNTVTTTISGGYPAINGSNFTVVPGSVSPASVTLNNATCANGGTITLSNLSNGVNYSFQVVDNNGCPITISGTFTGQENGTITYPQTNYCVNGTNPTPTIVGVTGGTFSSTPGLSINSSTGQINLASSTAGTYTITYTTPGVTCPGSGTFTLSIHNLPTVNAGLDVTVCAGQNVTLAATGTAGNNYSWNNGVTQNTPFTPAATTNYTVTASNNGCTATDQVLVTVNPLPTVNAGTDQVVCAGTAVTLIATGTLGNTYVWNNGVVQNTAFTPAATNTYTVTATNNGCINTDQVLVTVNPIPVVNAGNDITICAGNSFTPNATGATVYSWTNGLTQGTPYTPASTATFTVTGNANGCSSTDQITVTVTVLNTVNAGTDQTICMGQTASLTASGANTYVWDNTLSSGNPYLVSPTVTTTYTVVGTDINGCTGLDQVVVNVNPLPIINAGPDQTICTGASTTLNGSGASTLTWNNGVTNGVSFTPASTNTYTVTGTDANGCVNTDQVTITLSAPPNVQAGANVSVCEGENVILSGYGASTYTWNNGIVNGVPFTPPVGTTVYTVTGTSALGCVNTDQVTVIVNPNPPISFTADMTSGCEGSVINFTNTTPNSNNCSWLLSSGNLLNGCGTVSVAFDYQGVFDVTLDVTSNSGCHSSLTLDDYITIYPYAVADFYTPASNVSTLNSLIEFTNLSSFADSYLWMFSDDSPNVTSVNPIHQFPSNKENIYTVQLNAYNAHGCNDSIIKMIRIYEEDIYYVPNTFTPDGDEFNETFQPVFTSGFDPFDFTLLIFNRWGELIFESHDASKGWSGTYGVDGKKCEDGTYTWKIEFKTTADDERKIVVGHVNLIR